jgi:hypothetical protein
MTRKTIRPLSISSTQQPATLTQSWEKRNEALLQVQPLPHMFGPSRTSPWSRSALLRLSFR